MERYIEVEGVADVEEELVEQRVSLDVHVRAVQLEGSIQEADELQAACVRTLLEEGLRQEELTEGGGEVWRTWYWKRKPGQQSTRRILIACADQTRMYRALAALEPLFSNKRNTLDVSMQSGHFECPQERMDDALRDAVADARAKAETLATASGVELGSILRVEELEGRQGRSGAHGDEQWLGAITVAAASPDEPVELDAARRTRSLRVRVRFSIRG